MKILKRLLKWFLWLSGVLVLLIVLFLAVPGFAVSWRFPETGEPWVFLGRGKVANIVEERRVMLGGFEAAVVLVDKSVSRSPAATGWKWQDGSVFYNGDHWSLMVGARRN